MIMPLLDEAPGTYCEIGCGFGDAMKIAEGAGFQVAGTEMYQEYIDYCVNDGLNVRRGDIHAIPFEDEAFSVVFLEDVMEHLKNPFQYLSECARVLKPGGVLFSHTWSIETPTTVEEGFGSNWRDDHNLDLTAHTTIFCQPALEAYASGLQLSLMELVVTQQMNHSSPATRRGSNVRFVDLFWKKQAETGKQTAS